MFAFNDEFEYLDGLNWHRFSINGNFEFKPRSLQKNGVKNKKKKRNETNLIRKL